MAFTANPVTGDRGEVVITAARGLGERVVAGEAVGDEWLVRDGRPTRRRSVEQAIDARQAAAVAALARRAEAHLGAPQDVEWAIAGGRLYLLQARPMTALPEPADWTPPEPGYWMRSFRLGEWLPDPMTPLFRDWLLERLHEGLVAGTRRSSGARGRVPVRRDQRLVLHHGRPEPAVAPAHPLAGPGAHPRAHPRLPLARARAGQHPPRPGGSRRAGEAGPAVARGVLPDYQRLVADAERRVETATTPELRQLVDAVGRAAGEVFWSLAIVGGSAWKMEGCLARFARTHLQADARCGRPGPAPRPPRRRVRRAGPRRPEPRLVLADRRRAGLGAAQLDARRAPEPPDRRTRGRGRPRAARRSPAAPSGSGGSTACWR